MDQFGFEGPLEINTQLNGKCQSNSLRHYKDITSNEYNHRIKLNPLGEWNTMDIRSQIPTNHIPDTLYKVDYLQVGENLNAFQNADYQSSIRDIIKKQKYQKLLENDEHINLLCKNKNKEIKNGLDKRKIKLKEELTRIIRDALIFSKKNSPVKSMLPENIGEIIEKMKKENEDISLNLSRISKSSMGNETKPSRNDFLQVLGVDVDNLTPENINIDIEQAWNYINKWGKGRNVDEILRYKVVNSIMSLNEKKASQKVRQIYEKLAIYKEYLRKKKLEEIEKQKREEEQKMEELKKNPKLLIKLRIQDSVNNPKRLMSVSKAVEKKKKKKKKIEVKKCETPSKEVIKLNGYKNVDEVINFIDNSKKYSQSKLYKEHFTNIKNTKTVNQGIDRLINKNKIIAK